MAENNELDITPSDVAAIINDESLLRSKTPAELSNLQSVAKGKELTKINKFIMNLGEEVAKGELRFEEKKQYDALNDCLQKQKGNFSESSKESKIISAVEHEAGKSSQLIDFEAKHFKFEKLQKKRYVDVKELYDLVELNDYFNNQEKIDVLKKEQPKEEPVIEKDKSTVKNMIDGELKNFVSSNEDITISGTKLAKDLIESSSDKQLKGQAQNRLDYVIRNYDQENGLTNLKSKEDIANYDISLRTASEYFANTSVFEMKSYELPEPPYTPKMAEAAAFAHLQNPQGNAKLEIKKWDELSWRELADINILNSPKNEFDNSKNGIAKEREAFQGYLWQRLNNLDKEDLGKQDLAAIKEIAKTPYIKNKANDTASWKDRKSAENVSSIIDKSSIKLKTPNLENPELLEGYKFLDSLSFTEKSFALFSNKQKEVSEEKNDNYKDLILKSAQIDASKKFASLSPEELNIYREKMPQGREFQPFVLNNLLNDSITKTTIQLVSAQCLTDSLDGKKVDATQVTENIAKITDSNKGYNISENTLTAVLAENNQEHADFAERLNDIHEENDCESNFNISKEVDELDEEMGDAIPNYKSISGVIKNRHNLSNSSSGRKLLKLTNRTGLMAGISNSYEGKISLGVYCAVKNIKSIHKDILNKKKNGEYNGFADYIKNNKEKITNDLISSTIAISTDLKSIDVNTVKDTDLGFNPNNEIKSNKENIIVDVEQPNISIDVASNEQNNNNKDETVNSVESKSIPNEKNEFTIEKEKTEQNDADISKNIENESTDTSSSADDGSEPDGTGAQATLVQESEAQTDQDLKQKNLDKVDEQKTELVQQQILDRKEVDDEFERKEDELKAFEEQAERNTDEGREEDKKNKDVAIFVKEDETTYDIEATKNTSDASNAISDAELALKEIKKEGAHANYQVSDTKNILTDAQENAQKVDSKATEELNSAIANANQQASANTNGEEKIKDIPNGGTLEDKKNTVIQQGEVAAKKEKTNKDKVKENKTKDEKTKEEKPKEDSKKTKKDTSKDKNKEKTEEPEKDKLKIDGPTKKEAYKILKEKQENGKKMSIDDLHELHSGLKNKKISKKLHQTIKNAYEKTVSDKDFEMPKDEKEMKKLKELNIVYGSENGHGDIDKLRGVELKYTEAGKQVNDKIEQQEKGKDISKNKTNNKDNSSDLAQKAAAMAKSGGYNI